MKTLRVLFSSLFLILTFSAEAKSPPPGTGKADVPANIYIMLDTSGSMSRKITGGATMYYPNDVAVCPNGDLIVQMSDDQGIVKYDSAGNLIKQIIAPYVASTLAGQAVSKLEVDGNCNIFFRGNDRIVKLDSDGNFIRNFQGNLGSSSAPFNSRNIAVDPSGNLYALNNGMSTSICKWNSTGVLQTCVQCGEDCKAIAYYNGIVYASETRRGPKIKRWRASDMRPRDWFYLDGNPWINNYPFEMTVNAGGIYVNDFYRNKIQRYPLNCDRCSPDWEKGSYGTGNSQFRYPAGLASDSAANYYVADLYNQVIKKFDSNGNYLNSFGAAATRMSEAKKVIKKLVDTIDLTASAQFGLQTWSGSAYQRVKIDAEGANKIFKSLDPTDPLYSPSWYTPSGWTNLDRSMQEAYDYFMGNKPGVASPINAGASCQKNFLIVVSDGVWRDTKASQLAKALYDQKGVVTFVIGFHASGGNSNYIKLAKAGHSWPDSPLYSNNWQHLYQTLSDYIRSAISSRLTFSAPVIMPNISSGNHIFQSTFTLKNSHQWQGQLSKYRLTAGGQVGALQWDAGAKLDDKSESSRQIWTIANHHGVSTSMNNFKTSNLAGLKEALWELFPSDASDTKATNLINFVRGIDAYDENTNNNTTEKRWKLGDIYNSKLSVVGAPKAKIGNSSSNTNTVAYYRYQNDYSRFKTGSTCGGSCATRKELVYVGANDGMLHAFDSSDGEELWAFVPPNMLQSLKDMVSVKANSSNSIYGVDGTPVVKDIFYDNKWRTVLLSGMGKGGKGYFALDITNPTTPQFLFGFQNNTTASSIYHWDENGTRSTFSYGAGIPAEYDYSKVGYATSTPTIVAMPSGTGTKWVAVFGAGDNAGINNTYGSTVYIIDLENKGKVLKRIDLTDTASNGFSNSVPASIVAITPDTTSKADYKGAMIYLADLESKQWKLNLTNKGILYEFTPIFNAEATLDNDRMEFFQVTPSVGNDGSLWNFYGTGNQQKVQRIDNDINNRVFGIKDNKFPLYSSVNGLNNTAQSVLKNSSLGACPSNTDMGWYVGLGANKRVTGKLAIFNELVYSSEYLPNNSRICFPGKATLSEYSMACGRKSRSSELGEGIATGAVIFNNKIYVGITGEGSSDIKDDQGNVIGKKTNNLIVITPSGSGALGDGKITQESWREIY